ncbi:hypothetical protein G7046_g228 [Stylonectria norvegica]|nr:hypothetical protein G7046_g228 [Stylonectria norvegica]
MSGPTPPLWTPVQLQTIWSQLETQMTPFTSVLALDGALYRMLDVAAKRFFAVRFMNHVHESVMFCRDGSGQDRYFLGAPNHFVASLGTLLYSAGSDPVWVLRNETTAAQVTDLAPPSPPKKAQKIPRPPNAYILYRKERHTMVKETNPNITNNEISQILGRAWNMESREVRQKYKELSERVKQALLQKHPDYQYKPRRPSEKKKRARRNPNQSDLAVTVDVDAASSSPDSLTDTGASAENTAENA